MFSFSFILHHESYTIHDEADLALFFELLRGDNTASSTLHWNIIMHLDEALMEIITTYRGLLACLRPLNAKNQFLLLVKVGDILPKLIETSRHFSEILCSLPTQDQKERIVRQFRRRGFERIVHTAEDLANILEWLAWSSEKALLTAILSPDYIRWLVHTAHDATIIFAFTSPENKPLLREILPIEALGEFISSREDFTTLYQTIPLSMCKFFLKGLGVERLLDIADDDRGYHYILSRVSEGRGNILVAFLEKSILQSAE